MNEDELKALEEQLKEKEKDLAEREKSLEKEEQMFLARAMEQETDGAGKENYKRFSAGDKGAEFGVQTDGGKKDDEQGVAAREIELNFGACGSVDDEEEDRNQHAAGNRLRNVVSAEKGDSLIEEFAQEKS